MEYLAAVQGLEFHRPLTSSGPLEEAVARLRQRVPRLEDDRILAPDIDAAADLVIDLGELLRD
jgi:histidine ammonia-lyase